MKDQGKFAENCYNLLKKVPGGRVTTYKALAVALNTKAYRAVGQAMHNNPCAPKVPCHRVVASNGKMQGFAFGIKRKIKMLKKEGIRIENGMVKDLDRVLYKFNS